MNTRTEVDVALLGYAIQIEREAQHIKPGEIDEPMKRFKRHHKFTGEALPGNVESTNLEIKK